MNRIIIYGFKDSGKTTYISMLYYHFGNLMSGKKIKLMEFQDEESKRLVNTYIDKIKKAKRNNAGNIEIPPTNKKSDVRVK